MTLVTGYVVTNWHRMTELNLLGSSVKLRELTTQAEQAIDNLERGRVKIYRTLLSFSMRHPGGFARAFVDDRVPHFLEVVGMIRDEGIIADLSDDVVKRCELLVVRQLDQLNHDTSEIGGPNLSGLEPDAVVDVFRGWAARQDAELLTKNPAASMAQGVDNLAGLLRVRREVRDYARER